MIDVAVAGVSAAASVRWAAQALDETFERA